ncbi:MAG: 3-hydroxyacyl-CoA dehydrogenase NAD-binding domain-containing protein [Lautropia sp.]
MQKLVTLEQRGDIALLRIDNPPVNAISQPVIAALVQAVDAFERNGTARAMMICCAGRTFVAGGDIAAFDRHDFSTVPFNRLLARLEAQTRPILAVLHGTVLGGGLELALACHARIALRGTSLGFPEVRLGLLPGSLGTQRLPRLVGVRLALDLIASGRFVGADEALAAGLVDRIVDAPLEQAALAHLDALLAQQPVLRRLSTVAVDVTDLPPDFFREPKGRAMSRKAASPAEAAIVAAIEASLLPFESGERIEARLFEQLRTSPQSKARRHLFFAQRQAARIPGLAASDVRLRPIRSIGVLGAGTMGRGIAMSYADAGIPVVLVDTARPEADAALAAISRSYEASAAKGRFTAAEAGRRMALLRGGWSDDELAGCDLVIEAVFEDLELKQRVCARLGRICKPGAIIATNTSTLDVDALAQASGRPADLLGMHFFSPANVMRLLEVVRGRLTSPDVLATVLQSARAIGKIPVVSGVCYGFIGNRMAEAYMREAEFLMLEGATPAQIDGAVEALGFAMGPCRMLDMAGIDVGARTVIEYGKAGGLPPDPSYRAIVRRMFELGRFGQKTGAGYYRYEGRNAVEDPATMEIARELAAEHRIGNRADIPTQEIVERLLYPMINEAAKILSAGIAYRGSDIDVVWTAGFGFPEHEGGPLFMADRIGLSSIVARLRHFAAVRGNPFGYWTVSPLLEQLAAEGRGLSDWST